MGNTVLTRVFVRKDVKVLFIGLDGAGKSTILYRLKNGELRACTPTVGFNAELVLGKKVRMTIWDVGLRDRTRQSIKHYLPGTDCLVFVLDSADIERFEEALTSVLEYACGEPEVARVPVLVLANKQDLKYAIPEDKVRDSIVKNGCLDSRTWEVFGVSGLTGNGMKKTMDWLSKTLANCSNRQGEINRSISQVSVFVSHSSSVQDVNINANGGSRGNESTRQSFISRLNASIRRVLFQK